MHSWRVLIRAFLDAAPLYNQYDFSEPWDGPNNSRLLSQMPPVYACPSHSTTGSTTNYAGVFGENCVFRSAGPTRIADITDGTSDTIIVGEAVNAGIPWMKPEDIDITAHPAPGDRDGFSRDHIRGVPRPAARGAGPVPPPLINPAGVG